jgi:WD40 repeat protein
MSFNHLLTPLTIQGSVYVWHLLQYREKTQLMPITHFKAHAQYITRVLLSPDVKHLATCSADHTAKIWEVKDLESMVPAPGQATSEARPFKLESTLTGHQRWVWDCAFSADSAYLVTACSDHYARLWELHSEQIIRQYNGHHRGMSMVLLIFFRPLPSSPPGANKHCRSGLRSAERLLGSSLIEKGKKCNETLCVSLSEFFPLSFPWVGVIKDWHIPGCSFLLFLLRVQYVGFQPPFQSSHLW